MTIAELINDIDTLSETDRATVMQDVFKRLSGVSRQTLRDFQAKWDGTRPFEEFKQEQNKAICLCLQMECHTIGGMVHKAQGTEPLTMETEIEESGSF